MKNPEDDFTLCDKRTSILSHDGHALIIGGPGSGKTTIGLLKARRIALGGLQTHQSVLFLSFSNAATRRILESAEALLPKGVIQQVAIKTYHSFAWEVLRSHGYLTSSQRLLSIVASQDAAVIKAGLPNDEWLGKQERLYLEEGRVTYDLFADKAATILEGSTKALTLYSEAHPTIIVDEFQDTDSNQWRLVKALGRESNVIALGDVGQRIYAWRPGVDPKRLDEFGDHFVARVFDFGTENNRSPAGGIATYARALLTPGAEKPPTDDIKFGHYDRGQARFVVAAKTASLRALKEARKRSAQRRVSVAVAARSNPLVRLISDALSKPSTMNGRTIKPLRHDVLIDQTEIVLASRVVAYLLGTVSNERTACLAGGLERVADVFRASGKVTNIRKSDTLVSWAKKCREDKTPNTKCVNALSAAINSVVDVGLCGAPTQDWILVRQQLENADASELKKVAEHARFLRLLRRGSAIEETLSDLWRRNGTYVGAEAALEQAIVQEQLTDPYRETATISVMNMHQLKGREYDAVVLIEDEHRTFRGQERTAPYMETRRLLQMSLTRARMFAFVASSKHNSTLVIFAQTAEKVQ